MLKTVLKTGMETAKKIDISFKELQNRKVYKCVLATLFHGSRGPYSRNI